MPFVGLIKLNCSVVEGQYSGDVTAELSPQPVFDQGKTTGALSVFLFNQLQWLNRINCLLRSLFTTIVELETVTSCS